MTLTIGVYDDMEREFLKINGRECPVVCDGVLIGDWKEVQGLSVASITKRDEDTATLDGLVIKGYEMKFGAPNANGEVYESGAFDKFIEDYFVGKGLNMPVDIEHAGERSPEWLAGRVIYAESNSVGFYFVVYIPRTYIHYDMVLNMLREGILQGFSKFGYATNWEYKYNPDGTFSHMVISEFQLLAVSLVTTPANGLGFEKVQEVKNSLVFRKVEDKPKSENLFNILDL